MIVKYFERTKNLIAYLNLIVSESKWGGRLRVKKI